MKVVQIAGVAVATISVGTTLMGCADGGNPTPAPVLSVQDAWDNHFAAFGEQDVDKIKKDYDADSVLVVYNQHCPNTTAYKKYEGEDEIGGFFTALFQQLTANPDLNVPAFQEDQAGAANPTVVGGDVRVDENTNVFLVWSEASKGIEEATDCFLWKDGDGMSAKITRQNIVVHDTSDGACSGGGMFVDPGNAVPDGKQKIHDGWENHFNAFGARSIVDIMKDYNDASIVRVYDWSKTPGQGAYGNHTGLASIEALFTKIFADIQDPTSISPLVISRDYEQNSVFLVWEADAYTRATDTFLFDDEGIIVQQNVVVRAAGQSITAIV